MPSTPVGGTKTGCITSRYAHFGGDYTLRPVAGTCNEYDGAYILGPPPVLPGRSISNFVSTSEAICYDICSSSELLPRPKTQFFDDRPNGLFFFHYFSL